METSDDLISEASKIYKVLSNATRIKILYFLRCQEKYVQVSEIVSQLDIAQPIVWQNT